MAIGSLKIHVFKEGSYVPIKNAKATVIQNSERNYRQITQDLLTDDTGTTDIIELEAPPVEYSTKPADEMPYSLCDIIVEYPGYKKLMINRCYIYPNITSIQNCYLNPIVEGGTSEEIVNIGEHTMVGYYEPKEPESEEPSLPPIVKAVSFEPDKQIIPYNIMVHDGHPNNTKAIDYRVNYKDYIKNVVASEIYATWPIEAIKANVIAIISFTLNRLFTEWYRGKEKEFHISSSTIFDHKWIRGQAIPENIDKIVDEIFSMCIKKPKYKFPILAQYTDGKRVPHRQGWLSQWGSKELADKGWLAKDILNYYYGNSIELFEIKKVGDLQKSYVGYPLQLGSREESVKFLREYLNFISNFYPLIPKLGPGDIFDEDTKKAVQTFQGIFGLKKSGIVDYATWYKISDIYVGVTNINADKLRLIKRNFIPPIFNRDNSNFPMFTYFDKEL